MSAASPGVTVQRVASPSELMALAAEWNELQAACAIRHVLLDHRWVSSWWRHFGAGKALHVLRIVRNGRLAGIAPLMISRGFEAFPSRDVQLQNVDDYAHLAVPRWHRLVPIRRLSFLLNIPAANVRAHFLLVDDDPALLQAIAGYAVGQGGEWDMMVLDGLPEGSGQEERVREIFPAAGLRVARGRFVRFMLKADLPESMDAFLGRRSGHFRRRVRQGARSTERRLADLGPVVVREYRGAEIETGMGKMFALEQSSWKVQEERQRRLRLRLDDIARSFHLEVARAFAATDQAQVLMMEVGDRPLLGFFFLERDLTTTAVLTYMDESLSERINNTALFATFVERAITRGLIRIDFNGKTRNLAKWADSEVGFSRLVIFNRRPWSRLLAAVKDGAYLLSRAIGGQEERADASPPEEGSGED